MTASCPSGKRQFDSRRAANRTLGWIWRKARPGRQLETRPYWCHTCLRWHLTSQSERRQP